MLGYCTFRWNDSFLALLSVHDELWNRRDSRTCAKSKRFRHRGQKGFFLSLFYLVFYLRRFLNKSFYDAQQFVDGTNLFFDTALEHSDKSNTLGRKRFFTEQELQH